MIKLVRQPWCRRLLCSPGVAACHTANAKARHWQQALQPCSSTGVTVYLSCLLSRRWCHSLCLTTSVTCMSPLPLRALASRPVTDHTHCSMTACTKLYLHWSISLCLITGVTACLTWRQAAASLTACLYHVPYSMTACTNARLWREMYRKWALAFQFFLKSLGRSARSQYSVFDVSQWIFRFLLVIMYVLYSFAILSEHRLLRVFWMYFIYLVCKVYQRNQLLEK